MSVRFIVIVKIFIDPVVGKKFGKEDIYIF